MRFHFFHRLFVPTLLLLIGLMLTGMASATAPFRVTSDTDSGPGSLREALASGSGRVSISSGVATITIESPLTYAGTEPLRLIGSGQTISATGDFTLLEVPNGASVSIERLNFTGVGGFNLENPGTGKGVFIGVPESRTGTVRLELDKVQVRGVANHGIHVSDCTLGDDCGGGSGGGGDGSPASIYVSARRVTVDDVGNGKFDADGIRLDERNDGGIIFKTWASQFSRVGADGVELDEGNNGDVSIDVRSAIFERNGGFCVDAPLDLAQPCVEEDDGELELDLDDGFDVDEAGEGSLTGRVSFSLVSGNLDEGLDFDTEGPGRANLVVSQVVAFGNGDEGVKLSAADGTDVYIDLFGLTVTDNGNDGIQVEAEDGDGEVHVTFANGFSSGNEDDGLDISQENTESPGSLRIFGFSSIDSIDLENVVEP